MTLEMRRRTSSAGVRTTKEGVHGGAQLARGTQRLARKRGWHPLTCTHSEEVAVVQLILVARETLGPGNVSHDGFCGQRIVGEGKTYGMQ